MRGATVEVNCQCCKTPFTARVADRKRGWAKFCSKSCKAIKQEQRTGQNAKFHRRQRTNFRGSGVSREKFMRYASDFGGTPQFSRSGEYEGFTCGAFDNTEHQNHDRY